MIYLSLWTGLTCLLYYVNLRLYRRWRKLWLAPVIATSFVLALLIGLSGLSFQQYLDSTRWMLWMVGPLTLAMAAPVYQHRAYVRRWWLPLTLGTLTATLTALGSAALLAHWLRLPAEMARSLMARSISLPFAFAVSDELSGARDLTTLFVIVSGTLGLVLGDIALAFLPVRSDQARGATLGAVANVMGAMKAHEHSPAGGVMASLTMVFSGVLTIVVAPLFSALAG